VQQVAYMPVWGLGTVPASSRVAVRHAVRRDMRLAPSTWGLGDAGSTLANQIAGSAMQGASTASKTGSVITGAVQGAISATGAVLSTTLLTGSAICPICAPFFAIGAALVPLIAKIAEGCGQSCIEASDYANQIEPLLQQNLQAYTSTPAGQRTTSMQQAAINNFNASFSQLVSECQSVGGEGGTNCIADRQAGGCKWKATPWAWNADGSFTPAGAAGSGSTCWNWVYGYHDPIANDPYVVPDPTPSASSVVSSLTSGTTAGIPNEYLLLGALALIVAVTL
jgi:hypothetical protein